MAGKGLGTGLGALFGDEAFAERTNDFDYLPISKVEPRSGQPRTVFSEDELGELSESIAAHGVLQPLTVRKLSSGYYQIIAGERRWRAARMAGLTEVPARIIRADDKTATELALVENLQREGLNPIEEARGYKRLADEYGMTQNEIAQRVSKSRPVIANAVRLLALPQELLERVEKGELASGAARVLLSLDSSQQMLQAADKITALNMSVRQAESLVKKMKAESVSRKKPEKPGITVDYTKIAETELTKKLGRRVRIIESGKKSRIELEYSGADDLETLLEALGTISGKVTEK